MSTPDRDRRHRAGVTLCLALVILLAPAAAFEATVTVLPGGDAYRGEVTLVNASEYSFWEPGMLGERVPLAAKNVTVSGACGENCTYTQKNRNTIAFEKGNVTVTYEGPVTEKNFQMIFTEPSNITVTLPEGQAVKNPLLGRVSEGGKVSTENNTTVIAFDRVRSAEVRFYDPARERLLFIFGSVWLTVAVVLLFPFLLMRRRQE
ncbi:DUF5803 family protein [Methanofollis ethanolicus]|uniref:DUF5803 family protein n=1 Tax=Methanofollis ethanolicus TaxID=488124 RepID=UPI00128F5774|nr:DUF5803 family protein [Methanofollis ethanolicus]